MIWKNILDNTKTVITTATAVAVFSVGAWTLITDIFITRVEASELIGKLDLDTSYNKAFRLE